MTGANLWRAVAVLVADDTAEARVATAALRDALAPYSVRIYASGPHLVVVSSVPAESAADGLARLTAVVADVVPPAVVVADAWAGGTPLAEAPATAAVA